MECPSDQRLKYETHGTRGRVCVSLSVSVRVREGNDLVGNSSGHCVDAKERQ